jgi:hypothetical protein
VFRPTQVFSSTWRRTAALSIMLSLLALATLPVNGGGGISAGQLSMGCPAQKAGVGKNLLSSKARPGCANASIEAAVRCCGNDGSCISVCEFSQWRSERPRAAQRSPRRAVDGLAATWREAREECEAQGMRLCRPEQLGACCKTGCGMDGVAVWTSASCAGSGHPVAADHEPRRAHNALAATQLLGLQPATRVRARALCREGARLGSKMDGGWSVCLDSLAPADCVVYSAGSHAEVGFDLAMARRGCSVHAFDPTMEQLGLHGVVAEMRAANVSFHPWGLHGRDQAYPPGSALPWSLPGFVGGHQSTFRLRDVGAIMRDLGHERVDVLKLDIEGAEWAVLKALLATPKLLSGGAVRQLLIELHFVPQGAEVKPGGEHRQGQPPPLVGGPTTAAEVFEYNTRYKSILQQLQSLGFHMWKHDVNVGYPGAPPSSACVSRGVCHPTYHEVSLVWRPQS